MEAEVPVQVHDLAGRRAAPRDPAAQRVVLGVAVGDAHVEAVAAAAQEDLDEHLAARPGGFRRRTMSGEGPKPTPTAARPTPFRKTRRERSQAISSPHLHLGAGQHEATTRAATLTRPPGPPASPRPSVSRERPAANEVVGQRAAAERGSSGLPPRREITARVHGHPRDRARGEIEAEVHARECEDGFSHSEPRLE